MSMKKSLLVILLICLILAGCVPSLNPLYTDKDLIVLPGLEGTWIDQDNNFWTFDKGEDKSYRMTYSRNTEIKENDEIFKAHLVRLDNYIFMDLYPQEGAFRDKQGMMTIHYVPTHTFSKLQLTGDNLQINMLNPEWINNMKDQQRIFIGYEKMENGVLLTAKPKDLQRFISAYADDSKAFEKPEWRLKRYVKKLTISETTAARDTVSISIDTSTTAISFSTTTTIAPSLLGNAGTKGCSILYFAPLSVWVSQGELFQLNIILDNPSGTNIDNFGLWIRYNPKAVILNQESSFELDTSMFSGWTIVTSYSYPSKGELYLQFKALEEARTLSGMIGKLEFQATGKVSVSQVRFRFNRWGSLPNTFITYKHKDVLGKESDHDDGTISAMFRILQEP